MSYFQIIMRGVAIALCAFATGINLALLIAGTPSPGLTGVLAGLNAATVVGLITNLADRTHRTVA